MYLFLHHPFKGGGELDLYLLQVVAGRCVLDGAILFECKHVEMIVLGYRLVGEDGEICGGCRQLITVEKVKTDATQKSGCREVCW